ncbi:MAG: protein phosphatase 2C domain-containing protein, partial [bacterium]
MKQLFEKFAEIEKSAVGRLRHLGIYGLFDGVSTSSGYLASRLTSAQAADTMSRLSDSADVKETKSVMLEALKKADEQLKKIQSSTTADLVRVMPTGEGQPATVVYAHVGDSRIYKRRVDGSLELITVDQNEYHLMISSMVDGGEIDRQRADFLRQARFVHELADAPPELAEAFKRQNILWSSVGGQYPDFVTGTFELCPGESIVMVTDGISDNLSQAEMSEVLNGPVDGGDDSLVDRLVELADRKSRRMEDLRADIKRFTNRKKVVEALIED